MTIMDQKDVNIKVRKGSGEYVDFDIEKLRSALARSGADIAQIESVLQRIRASLYEGITTKKIYQIAYSILRKKSYRSAGRYRLKKAILELGPTGYPFEKFVARLIESQGYQVSTGQIVEGKCVSHEIDVVAKKEEKQLMVECKFHHDNSSKSDVKVPLYIHSRFLDVEDSWRKVPENREMQFEGIVVTNSRFSEDAVKYASCIGLTLISWDYPTGNSLKDWIDSSGCHPLTSLQTLTKAEKQKLLEKGFVLCREIKNLPQLLSEIISDERRIYRVLKEIDEII